MLKLQSMRAFTAIGCILTLSACTSASNGMPGDIQIQSMPAPDRNTGVALAADYEIGPLDKIDVRVFGQPDLTVEKIQVDSSGQIVLPLIGAVQVGGKTPKAVSEEVAARLSEKYFRAPSVSIIITESVSQRVTVTGAVTESGIYALRGRTTLVQAISMAKGPNLGFANLHQVAIFRNIDNRRARAVFDVSAIQKGKAEDPVVYGGDTIVVAESRSMRAWRELIGALPGIGVFSYF